MSRRLAVLAGALVWLIVTPLCAQNPVPQEIYGAAVHAYFSGDYRRTFDLLTPLIDTASSDPRVYYFRGLSLLHLGREDEAKRDFQRGAKLEVKDPDQTRDVSKALERIQGPWRVLLEQFRAEARLRAFQLAEERRKARYEEMRREETRVLQQQPEGVPTPKPVPPPPTPATGAGPSNPPPAEVPSGKPASAAPEKKTPPPLPEPEGNPFESTKPAPAPAGPGKAPAGAAAPVAPPAGAADDVLGTALGALGVKTPAGKTGAGAAPALAVPPFPDKVPSATKPPAEPAVAEEADSPAPPVAGAKKRPAAAAAATPDAAKPPAEDEPNPFAGPAPTAKGKSAAGKSSPSKAAAGKKTGE